MTGVRHHQLLLARERAVLEDEELEVSAEMGDAIRDVDLTHGLTKTNFNLLVAAEDEVEAVEAVYDSGRVTLDLLLDAQRRRAEAESAYYRALVDYNRAIMRVHYWKGSLLEYNGVLLAEGPWPGKAQFDALRRARQRDAATYLDYGFDRPNVISRGPYGQMMGQPLPERLPSPTEAEEIQPLENEGEEIKALPQGNGGETSSLIPADINAQHDLRSLPVVDQELVLLAELPASDGQTPRAEDALRQIAATIPATQPTQQAGQQNQYLNALNKLSTPENGAPAAKPVRSSFQLNASIIGGRASSLNNGDESQANHSTTEAAAKTAVGQRAER